MVLDIKISLSFFDMIYAVITTTVVNIIIASAWYSLKVFGVPWATYNLFSYIIASFQIQILHYKGLHMVALKQWKPPKRSIHLQQAW
jgi:hypothetical protein